MEDDLYEILAEEIRKEIDAEIISLMNREMVNK
jgi:hypothetical protein